MLNQTNKAKYAAQKGLNLIELLIAISIFMLVVRGASSVFNFSLRILNKGIDDSLAQIQAHDALDVISKYVNSATDITFNNSAVYIPSGTTEPQTVSSDITINYTDTAGASQTVICRYTHQDPLNGNRPTLSVTRSAGGSETFRNLYATKQVSSNFYPFAGLSQTVTGPPPAFKGLEITLEARNPRGHGQTNFPVYTKAYSRVNAEVEGMCAVVMIDRDPPGGQLYHYILKRFTGRTAVSDAVRYCGREYAHGNIGAPDYFNNQKLRVLVSVGQYVLWEPRDEDAEPLEYIGHTLEMDGFNVPILGGFNARYFNIPMDWDGNGVVDPGHYAVPDDAFLDGNRRPAGDTVLDASTGVGPLLTVHNITKGGKGYNNGELTIERLTFRNGRNRPSGSYRWSGIAFYKCGQLSSVNIKNNIIKDSHGENHVGAGINYYDNTRNVSVNIVDNLVTNNTSKWRSASDGGYYYGSGIYVYGAKSLEISGNTVTNNRGGRFTGITAIRAAEADQHVKINNNTVIGNAGDTDVLGNPIKGAAIASGINYYDTARNADLTISGNNVDNNISSWRSASDGGYYYGAGIYVYNTYCLKVSGNRVTDNLGGRFTGIATSRAAEADQHVKINNNTVTGNAGAFDAASNHKVKGGAIGAGINYKDSATNGFLTISGNTVNSNLCGFHSTSIVHGAGIYVHRAKGTSIVDNPSISGNIGGRFTGIAVLSGASESEGGNEDWGDDPGQDSGGGGGEEEGGDPDVPGGDEDNTAVEGEVRIERNQVVGNLPDRDATVPDYYLGAVGAGINCADTSRKTTVYIMDNVVTDNIARPLGYATALVYGSGVYVRRAKAVGISRNMILRNQGGRFTGISLYAGATDPPNEEDTASEDPFDPDLPEGAVNIIDNQVKDNKASIDHARGAGINCYDSRRYGIYTITGNEVERNTSGYFPAYIYYGSGIYLFAAKSAIINNNKVLDNRGGRFAGIAAHRLQDNQTLEIKNNEIRRNAGAGIDAGGTPASTPLPGAAVGAGINFRDTAKNAKADITGNIVNGNVAFRHGTDTFTGARFGAGIYVFNARSVNISDNRSTTGPDEGVSSNKGGRFLGIVAASIGRNDDSSAAIAIKNNWVDTNESDYALNAGIGCFSGQKDTLGVDIQGNTIRNNKTNFSCRGSDYGARGISVLSFKSLTIRGNTPDGNQGACYGPCVYRDPYVTTPAGTNIDVDNPPCVEIP